MYEIIKTDEFDGWLRGLRDIRARAKIQARLKQVSLGNLGDTKPITGAKGISELRIDYGPGYRLYYLKQGPIIIVLLCGGDKSSQKRDIEKAKSIAPQWKE